MKIPIIMVAFGTTSKATITYRYIEKITRDHFGDHEIIWSFSSRIITQQLQLEGREKIYRPAERFSQLTELGYKSAIVQSLHLFAGSGFDALILDMKETELDCIPGAPLINSPQDYHEICQILQPLITTNPKKATLILGHGTYHPTWTAYYCLETFLRQQFGPHIFVGTVEKYPDSGHLVDQISAAGFEEVRIIPFFLVAGMHYERDIIGDSEASWQSRFSKKKIAVETTEQGLGMLPGFTNIIIRHIEEAIDRSNN
jgi:sirohydrochlorin cobaltochelatase